MISDKVKLKDCRVRGSTPQQRRHNSQMNQRHLIPLQPRGMQLGRRIDHSILVGMSATTASLPWHHCCGEWVSV